MPFFPESVLILYSESLAKDKVLRIKKMRHNSPKFPLYTVEDKASNLNVKTTMNFKSASTTHGYIKCTMDTHGVEY